MIKVAVIGVGYLGQHHARIYSSLPECHLVGIADIDGERGRTIAAKYRTKYCQKYQELLNAVDAVSIAVPTTEHYPIAAAFLKAGCHVLVEKPMTSSLKEADELIRLAEHNKKILFVGHTERFNPSIRQAKRKIKDPGFIEAHRLGTFAKRSTDVDVVLDLMIHDLDIISHIVSDEVRSIDSIGVRALTDKIDIANARITFKKGCVANLTASRISAEKVRKIRIFQPESYLSIDCAEQEVQYYYLARDEGKSPCIRRESLVVEKDEPLKGEILSFISSLKHEKPPEVPGEDGRRALKIAFEIRSRMTRS